MKSETWIKQASDTIASMCISHQMGRITTETFASNLLMFALDVNDLPMASHEELGKLIKEHHQPSGEN